MLTEDETNYNILKVNLKNKNNPKTQDTLLRVLHQKFKIIRKLTENKLALSFQDQYIITRIYYIIIKQAPLTRIPVLRVSAGCSCIYAPLPWLPECYCLFIVGSGQTKI